MVSRPRYSLVNKIQHFIIHTSTVISTVTMKYSISNHLGYIPTSNDIFQIDFANTKLNLDQKSFFSRATFVMCCTERVLIETFAIADRSKKGCLLLAKQPTGISSLILKWKENSLCIRISSKSCFSFPAHTMKTN